MNANSAEPEPSEPSTDAPTTPDAEAVQAAAPPPTDEKTINAPDRETLLLLTIVFLVTFVSWGGAKMICNAHPLMIRAPAKATTAQLSATAKSAALERQQRLATYDFDGALELSTGAATEEIKTLRAKCLKDPASCESERKRRAATTTRAVLLGETPTTARARVISRLGDQTTRFAVILEKDGLAWRTTQRSEL